MFSFFKKLIKHVDLHQSVWWILNIMLFHKAFVSWPAVEEVSQYFTYVKELKPRSKNTPISKSTALKMLLDCRVKETEEQKSKPGNTDS